jgi:hypothetical protein
MHLVRPLVKQVPKDLPKLQKRISIAIGVIERLNMDGFEAQ